MIRSIHDGGRATKQTTITISSSHCVGNHLLSKWLAPSYLCVMLSAGDRDDV